jgi:phosphoribulokinase
VTALAPEAQNFDLMYEQVKSLKEGKSVAKPIYNHVSGLLDPAETIESPKVSTGSLLWAPIEGLAG